MFGKVEMLAIAVTWSAVAFTGTIVVDSDGSALQRAIEEIRAARKAGDTVTWIVRVKGFNAIRSPLCFAPEDHDIVFAGETGACISGGARIEGWTDSGKGWWETPAPLKENGEVAYFEQLWTNGRRARRARYPDEGYFKIVRPSVRPLTNAVGRVAAYRESFFLKGAEERAVLAAARPDEMNFAAMTLIHAFSFARRIVRGYDAATGEVWFTQPCDWDPKNASWRSWTERQSIVAFENVRAGFDAPGEWYYDVPAKKILYRPRPDETLADLEAVAPLAKLSTLILFKGDFANGKHVRNIGFRNIAIAHSAVPRPRLYHFQQGGILPDYGDGPTESWQYQAAQYSDAAIMAEGVRNLSFVDCRIEHTGNYAFRFRSGCMSNEVVNCAITDLGAGGVWMGADINPFGEESDIPRRQVFPDRPDSTAFNLVSNCTITAAGMVNPEATGVIIGHCSDTKVVHNDIHDIGYSGVSCGWVWGFMGSVAQRNEIAYNLIYDLGRHWMSDMGGVYMLGTSYGTKVHHNVIHDIWCYDFGAWGLYLDQGSEGIEMSDNVIWNTSDGGFHQHYGNGSTIRNNVFAFVKRAAVVRNGKGPYVEGVPCTFNFCNNISYVEDCKLVEPSVLRTDGIWANNVWYDRKLKEKANFAGMPFARWTELRHETGSVLADPQFVDADGFDFRLRSDSPALKLGFRPIDVSKVGPQ